jgi:hypothetical protein
MNQMTPVKGSIRFAAWSGAFYGSEYDGGGVPDPRLDNVGESVRFSIARPRGSLAKLEGGAAVCSPIMVRPKKTSGEVHAATARRMWFVRNERPTW